MVSARRGRFVTGAISDSPRATITMQFGKKLHAFSMGVNVWQLYKYVISVVMNIGAYYYALLFSLDTKFCCGWLINDEAPQGWNRFS